MRINGGWYEPERQLPRAVVIGRLEAADGSWIECPFLIDTGADTTVLSAKVLYQLGRPFALAPVQLGGIGGGVETCEVHTTLRFERTDGTPADIKGAYSAFQVEDALEMSVLGYDVLHLFALIVDRPGDTVCLIHPPHRYTIQSS
ncbi:pepsin/retropepsin-like aspartic protease family protein [Frigoriglobus tundricola]|uniref:Peptidase A2 domain-containing protein n=1 Tax=Frigoriglobus tundricola TaxID=2774151 RepID=A0A6M5Z1T6_9BACT|nr:aspartyl protease family protein [Frigoriglobus tundricola]QJX00129.1 hypothetical protein FTUN_7753 [Frigoriglobus tundricola]